MSKTRGNIIDPSSDRPVRHRRLPPSPSSRWPPRAGHPDVRRPGEGYRNFMNKLFQAGRFVRMNLDDATPWELPDELPVTDRWILSRLSA